jgi:small redox-active disulfide protein 2
MLVKILGSGCTNCINLEKKVRNLVAENGIDADIVKVSEIQDIVAYGILRTPGLVINETVKSSGAIPKDSQILEWLREGAAL